MSGFNVGKILAGLIGIRTPEYNLKKVKQENINNSPDNLFNSALSPQKNPSSQGQINLLNQLNQQGQIIQQNQINHLNNQNQQSQINQQNNPEFQQTASEQNQKNVLNQPQQQNNQTQLNQLNQQNQANKLNQPQENFSNNQNQSVNQNLQQNQINQQLQINQQSQTSPQNHITQQNQIANQSQISNQNQINKQTQIDRQEPIAPQRQVKQQNDILNQQGSTQKQTNESIKNQPELKQPIQMNQLNKTDRSVYVKNLLGLPQTLGEILKMAQSNTPINASNTLIINNLNEDLVKSQKVLAQIFDENTDKLPAIKNATEQIQALQNQLMQNVQSQAPKDAISLIFSGMIHMPAIADMITKNSKQAMSALIIAMASASKGGMTSEQIRETLNVINSCVAMAESGNPAQTLKSLMLLYLPWLPLNDGVGFDLEIETDDGENESNDSKLTVLIQTINFGNVKGVFTLTTSNSVNAYIICSEDFPKNTLQKSLSKEAAGHAMNMTLDVEAVQVKSEEVVTKREAKVNLSATNEMNPYLLLIAHAFIRNTITIDSGGVIEDSSQES